MRRLECALELSLPGEDLGLSRGQVELELALMWLDCGVIDEYEGGCRCSSRGESVQLGRVLLDRVPGGGCCYGSRGEGVQLGCLDEFDGGCLLAGSEGVGVDVDGNAVAGSVLGDGADVTGVGG